MSQTSSRARATPLPEGTVTFLFTDIQGSTKLLQQLGERYTDVLSIHHQLLREVFGAHNGVEVSTHGDAFFVAFPEARDAVQAAATAQRAILEHSWPHGEKVFVRMGIHTGVPVIIDDDYAGIDVHRAARIAGIAHGGQVVVSAATVEASEPLTSLSLSFQDLGRHLLKDLERPEHLFQEVAEGLPGEFPPIRSIRPRSNIPTPVTEIVGRATERARLGEMLRRTGTRLVTLSGPGGTGKTRLATTVALDIRDGFPDGSYFVDLARVQGSEVAQAIAESLEVAMDEEGMALQAVIDHVGERDLLLVLDNFEHVVDAAPVVAELLTRSPRVTCLVTSQVILRLDGEVEFPLSPLTLPESDSSEAVIGSESGQLFLSRAHQVNAGFEVTEQNAGAVAEVCRLLDGLPLAIELAAARIKLFPPEVLLSRLDDRLKVLTGGSRDAPERHRTLRSTLDWSYRLLPEELRSFFRDLAVFSGGATLEAVENVLSDHGDPVDLLTTLVDHSLVRQEMSGADEPRFSLLQTIREYALELLDERGTGPQTRDRHADYYLSLARASDSSVGEEKGRAQGLVANDHDNMRAALAWLLDRARDGSTTHSLLALELASSLGTFWYTHGFAVEGAEWLDSAIAVAVDPSDEQRAVALRTLGVLFDQQRDAERAQQLFERALEHYRRSGDQAGEAACLNSLGVVAFTRQDLEAADDLLSASTSLRRGLGDEDGTAGSLSNLALVALNRGDLATAEKLILESMALDEKTGNEWGIAVARCNLGVLHLERGEIDIARRMSERSLITFVEVGDLDGAAENLETLAGIAAAQKSDIRAARLAGASSALRVAVGIPMTGLDRARFDRWMVGPRTRLTGFDTAFEEGGQMTTEQAIDYALERSHRTSLE